ncbi:hypothetical protein [Nocardioides dongkuii]|uniref:hypothetical protein n=1 Tax=Nocardioides dongkuii TaxID=2760089 RepID=UPI0015FC7F9F|nr:hypothetical protein [Nocardioides dongkuii]
MSSLPPGPPPSSPPPSSQPPGAEVLERGAGGPIPPHDRATAGGGRRKWWLAGGAVVGLGAVGGAAFGAWWYLSTGPQPAEALPAGTIGYASIDLDPSGEQKLDALRTLRKFPAIDQELDLSGDVSEIDIKERVIGEALESAPCEIDYDEVIGSWLGDRAAVAAVDLGEEMPEPVFVVQVTDADAAEDGIEEIFACGETEESEMPGLEIVGDWLVLAETQSAVDDVVAETEDGSLADDETFREWVDAAGDPGVVTLYAAPEAGAFLGDSLGGMFFPGHSYAYSESSSMPAMPAVPVEPSASAGGDVIFEEDDPFEQELEPEVPDEMSEALENFEGAAVTIRFDGGSVEVEVAGDPGLSGESFYAGDGGADALATLPADTAAAVGIGFAEGWFDELMATASSSVGEDAETLLEELEEETGMSLPEDAETLAGDSAVLSIGGDFDADTFADSEDGTDVPVALKVLGDTGAIEEVLDQIRAGVGSDQPVLDSTSEGDAVAIGPHEEYRDRVLEDGDLGDEASYRDVVPEKDAAAVLYVDVARVVELVEGTMGPDDEIAANLAPLVALGMSAWEDDGVAHSLLRISTD